MSEQMRECRHVWEPEDCPVCWSMAARDVARRTERDRIIAAIRRRAEPLYVAGVRVIHEDEALLREVAEWIEKGAGRNDR